MTGLPVDGAGDGRDDPEEDRMLDRVKQQARQDFLPRSDRPAWDPQGASRMMCIWFPIMALLACVAVGIVSVIAGAL